MTTATTTTRNSYKKTKSGEWVVCGPVATMKVGLVLVSKKDGTIEPKQIDRLGRPFDSMVYGYIAASVTPARPNGRYGRGGKECVSDGNCSSFGSGRSCGGHDCDGY